MNRVLKHAILMLITGGIIASTQGAGILDTNMSPVDRFISFVTDVPPIDNIVFSFESRHHKRSIHQMRYRPSDKLYQWPEKTNFPPSNVRFRYRPQYFFSRILNSHDDYDSPLTANMEAVGIWNDEYWSLDFHTHMMGKPSLHLYCYEPEDWGNAMANCLRHLQMFVSFTSFWLSEPGSGRLIKGTNTHLQYVSKEESYPVNLLIKDDVPIRAVMKRHLISPNGSLEADVTIEYSYDTSIAPLGIPVQFVISLGPATGRIHALKLADPHNPISREVIMPDCILTNKSLLRFVRTNRIDYYINAHGKWQRLDISPEQAMAQLEGLRHRNRKNYFLVATIFTLLLAPVIVARAKTKPKQNQSKLQNVL